MKFDFKYLLYLIIVIAITYFSIQYINKENYSDVPGTVSQKLTTYATLAGSLYFCTTLKVVSEKDEEKYKKTFSLYIKKAKQVVANIDKKDREVGSYVASLIDRHIGISYKVMNGYLILENSEQKLTNTHDISSCNKANELLLTGLKNKNGILNKKLWGLPIDEMIKDKNKQQQQKEKHGQRI